VAVDLYLIRHGETAWSRAGQHTGITDLPLLPEGEEQARRLGEHLRGVRFAAVWSSDRVRAIRTAELAGLGTPAATSLLREFDYGEYEGLTSAEIRRNRPDWQLYVDGCPGGESPAQVADRARAFLATLEGVEGAVAICSHGHLLRALGAVWLRLPIAVAGSLALDTASAGVLHDGSRGRLAERWNWTPRLVVHD
jgi:broad specificity phosphatase PhoE